MVKIKAKGWMIFYTEPLWDGDDDNYTACFEYKDKNGKHELTANFKSYGAAYGWLAERVEL